MPSRSLHPDRLVVEATSVGRPRRLARANGQEVWSAIAKQRVDEPSLALERLNLAGDDQADRTVHGGLDKAVYLYPSEHFSWWRDELGLDADVGSFGENVTTSGLIEDEVAVGDRFHWGDAVVEVSQPRSPCYKLALHLGRPDVLKAMIRSARTGWYLRVVEPGTVPTTGDMVRISSGDAPSVAEVFRTTYDRDAETESLRRILAAPALAEQWAAAVAERLARLTGTTHG